MKNQRLPHCAPCDNKQCRDRKDCFGRADHHKKLYQDPVMAKLHQAASAVEARYYGKETRLGEIILFAKELGCKKIGLVFCVGLSEEAVIIEKIFARHFEVASVCCKGSALKKDQFSLEKLDDQADETMCNPAGQADLLDQAGTELNVMCGLCVGHDSIFYQTSKAPVTTLIVKDRVLGHNPAAAVYSPYIRRKFGIDD
ncbi:DUF1847 domain-containing protein [Planctomycetota bacterium]